MFCSQRAADEHKEPASGCPARIIVVAQKVGSNGKNLK
jgi:hypothetical protein